MKPWWIHPGTLCGLLYKQFYETDALIRKTSLVVLHSQTYAAGIRGHYHKSSDCFEYPPKTRLKSSHPQKIRAHFSTQKIPGIENFKPHKSFDHPRHLKSGVPPLPLGIFLRHNDGTCTRRGLMQLRKGCFS